MCDVVKKRTNKRRKSEKKRKLQTEQKNGQVY